MASISKYFSLEDLSWSDTAARNRIDNMPKDQAVIDALTALASSVLDPIRAHFGVALRPNSGFRCRALEEAIYYKQVARMRARGGKLEVDKWFEKKQHPRGLAADIEVPGVANRALYEWIAGNLDFDQLILEGVTQPTDPNSGWVHVSFNAAGNRHMKFEMPETGL